LSPEICLPLGSLGDRNEGTKKSMTRILFGGTSQQQQFSCNQNLSGMMTQNADRLSEHVMPLKIQNHGFYYEAKHASLSTTVIKITKWTFFWILQGSPSFLHTKSIHLLSSRKNDDSPEFLLERMIAIPSFYM